MKINKLRRITIILFILLITMVGFIGVYYKDKNTMKNGILDYQYASDLTGKRVITLEVDNSTNEVIKDADGNVIESATDEEIAEKGYKKEQTKVNSDENLTVDNYNIAKELIENRLQKLSVIDYEVKVEEETGKIVIEIPENSNVDDIINNLTTIGKFEIIDTQTKEVLLNNSNIKNCEVLRNSTSTGTSIYFSIEFKDDAKKKLEEISKTYVKTENTNNTENTENSEEKTITMQIDGSQVMNTAFEQPITDGKMYLTVGKETTDIDTLNNNLGQARSNVAVLSNGPLPLTYDVKENVYVQSELKDKVTDIVIISIAAALVITTIIFVIKYKGKGLLVSASNIGFCALFLLMIRYWNVVISKEGIVALFTAIILNFILTNKLLANLSNKNVTINQIMKKFTFTIIPLVLIAVMFSFVRWSSASSFGMIMFWGLVLIELYNLLVTKNLLKK